MVVSWSLKSAENNTNKGHRRAAVTGGEGAFNGRLGANVTTPMYAFAITIAFQASVITFAMTIA
jgi:hypothetical protein